MNQSKKGITTLLLAEFLNLKMLNRIKTSRNIHIVGVSGTEGSSIAIFLQKLGVSFVAHDFSETEKFKRNFKANHFAYLASKRENILKKLLGLKELKLQKQYLKNVEKADLIFVSQNWEAYPSNQKLKKIFAENSQKFATITQLYFQLFPGKIIAVTGTNGKSTTTKLISKIMSASKQKDYQVNNRIGKKNVEWTASRQIDVSSRQRVDKLSRQIWFTGNDRRNTQALNNFKKWKKSDWLVIEISNRQLKFPLGRAPEIGVITNVSPNHLNEYEGSFSAYKRGKFGLISKQRKENIAVLNYDNGPTQQFAKKIKSTHLYYSTKSKLSSGIFIDNGWIICSNKLDKTIKQTTSRQIDVSSRQRVDNKICRVDKIKLIGEHNLSNILAAVSATFSAGVDKKIICRTIKKFQGIPQRLELVFEKRGVRFINDSASTTPESTIAALKSFPKKSVNLIAGGESKGLNYKKLSCEIRQQKVQVVLLESPLVKFLGDELKKEKVEFKVVKKLQTAVKISAKNATKGEIVLLSPAAAWFCYFANKIPLGGRGFEQFAKTFS